MGCRPSFEGDVVSAAQSGSALAQPLPRQNGSRHCARRRQRASPHQLYGKYRKKQIPQSTSRRTIRRGANPRICRAGRPSSEGRLGDRGVLRRPPESRPVTQPIAGGLRDEDGDRRGTAPQRATRGHPHRRSKKTPATSASTPRSASTATWLPRASSAPSTCFVALCRTPRWLPASSRLATRPCGDPHRLQQ
jgi:hypothetical protein